jgi:hypothetical protein
MAAVAGGSTLEGVDEDKKDPSEFIHKIEESD